ncbi:copper resistance protein CopC [Micromonospora sp. WMMD812]|uniref:copper resistance CopC family protein n=1 Tax=Micromonospora sp. WMMD812 TaxID=3015152 RepID=UPI00248CE2F3|nr:copper resistance protein CopC [Micromonospora sp. WMMD812]WBB67800.1 copper resistance protein CopC [Micromonospora sp. WMMD812]WBB67810.1 copper resistance protein CopC [Micromonospora sp. WMMD812]
MRRLPPALGRALSGLLALVLASAIAVVASAPPAAAHGTLAMSTPAEGATVREPLTTVQLYFTEKVAANAYFTITAPGGGRVDNGWTYAEPRPLDKPVREYFLVQGKFEPREYTTGFPAVVTVAHLPAVGQYSVSYLSVASDGDPVRGTLSFRYTGRVTAAPQGWSPPTGQPDPSLLAAVEQHGTSGHTSGSSAGAAAPSASSGPTAMAAPSTASDNGGIGWGPWAGVALTVVAAVAALVAWRRRPATAGRASGGRRASGPTSRQRGGGSRSGGGTGGAGRAGATRKAAGPGSGGKTTRPGPGGKAAEPGSGGKVAGPGGKAAGPGGKAAAPALVPARKGGAVVTARTAAATGPAKPGRMAATASTVASQDGDSRDATTGRPAASDPDDAAPTREPRPSNVRLALLVGGLVVTLLAGFGLGRLGAGNGTAASGAPTAPAAGAPAAGQAVSAADGHQHAPGTGPHTDPGDVGTALAAGTAVSAGGYTLQPVERSQPAGVRVDYRFRVVGTDRQAATRFAVVHDKPLHLIVVGRDLAGYQHLHPTMAPDGTWSVPLTLARPGGYRIYADFAVTAANGSPLPLVLGVDHLVPGAHTPTPLPPAQPQATAGPFAVAMEGTPTVGATAPMSFRVSRTNAPVQPQRYLGAYGHLVVVREGDLGYVHVHPEAELVDGAIKFWLTAPSPGRYRAFLDFQIDGTVHTAEYTINLP